MKRTNETTTINSGNLKTRSLKVATLIALGFGLMGNQSCEKQPVVVDEGPRQLKWYADAGMIQSAPVKFGDDGAFDFGYVASEQLHGVLFNSKGFTTSYSGPGIQMGASGPELAGAQTMYQKVFGTKTIGSELYYSDEARCLITLPDVKVTGTVLSYELVSGNNIEIGFNQNAGHTGFGLGANFSMKMKQLSMQLYGLDTAKDLYSGKTRLIASPLVTQEGKDSDGKVTLSVSQINAGYGWYKNTPLSKLTEGALQQGVDSIKTEMNKVSWTTKVLDVQTLDDGTNPLGDGGVVIKGGTDVNLKKGDQVAFYDEKTLWKGTPCESDFLGFARLKTEPFAYGEVIYADRYFSTVAIVKRMDNTKIKPGWRVELFKRVEDVEAEAAAAKKAADKVPSATKS
jgi:hypothetical protein